MSTGPEFARSKRIHRRSRRTRPICVKPISAVVDGQSERECVGGICTNRGVLATILSSLERNPLRRVVSSRRPTSRPLPTDFSSLCKTSETDCSTGLWDLIPKGRENPPSAAAVLTHTDWWTRRQHSTILLLPLVNKILLDESQDSNLYLALVPHTESKCSE